MRKNKIIPPLIGTLCIGLPATAGLVSCSNETEYVLEWSTKDGQFQYDKSIVPFTGSMDWHEATNMYFDAVNSNKGIFLNDVVQTFINYDHGFGCNAADGDAAENVNLVYVNPDRPWEKIITYVYDVVGFKISLTKWDINTHRVSFKFHVDFKSHVKSYNATGHYDFEWYNCPIALYYCNFGLPPRCADERSKHKENSDCWWLLPEGVAKHWAQEETHEEVVDPIYPFGAGGGWLLMCELDDWYIRFNESYTLPYGQTISYSCDHFDPNWMHKIWTTWADDGEIMGKWKYAYGHAFYFEGITSMEDVINED